MTKNILNSFTNKVWTFPQAEAQAVKKLQSELNIPAPVANLLVQRGYDTPSLAHDFLYPSLQMLPSPFLMKGMQESVEIIFKVISEQKPIVIYGDYDVDGVTATAVLIRFFNEIGVNCRSCHPDRFKNGYGLKAGLVEDIVPNGQGLVITVDCGISDLVEVERLVQTGWQVIVTDHHQPPEQLPKAHAIVNPWQDGCQFPCKDLAGVGVSFYLVMGIRNYLHQKGYWQANTPPPNLKKNLDLVAIGTIADMVPLRTINRVFAKAGLEVLACTENLGLIELLALCHLQPGQVLNHEDVSFQIGPRLNAAGRMGDANRASTLLSSGDQHLVRYLAEVIQQENIVRRDLTSQFVIEAMRVIAAQDKPDQPCLIIHGQNWHLGLLGIIASRLVDQFSKPVIVLSGIGTLKGSARSIPGINIHETLAACADKIIEYGGHSNAAGLSIKESNLASFIDQVNEIVQGQMLGGVKASSINLSLIITQETAFADLEAIYTLLAPFGQDNPEPIFTTEKPCRLRNMQVIGKEKNHLRFLVSWDGLGGRWLDGIGFGFAKVIGQAHNGEAKLEIAFTLKENRFNGQKKPQVMLQDVML